MQIRRAQATDAAKLTEIAFAAKRHWRYPESWIGIWRGALTITPAIIAADQVHVAIVDRQTVGFYALHKNGDGLELSHLWVLPEMMGRGIGRSLFAHAVEQARSLGAQRLTIESDPNAEGFYLRLHAHRVGRNTTHVDGERRELPVLVYELDRPC